MAGPSAVPGRSGRSSARRRRGGSHRLKETPPQVRHEHPNRDRPGQRARRNPGPGRRSRSPAPATPQNVEPIAPERKAEPSKPVVEFTPKQHAALNEIVAERAKRAKESAEKPAEERIAELEQKHEQAVALAEAKAVNAIVARAGANSVDPETTATLLRARFGELTSNNEAEILEVANTILTEKPFLALPEGQQAPAPAPTPASGVNAPDGTRTVMSEAELENVTLEQLAADPELPTGNRTHAGVGIVTPSPGSVIAVIGSDAIGVDNAPFAWADGDQIVLSGTIELA